MAEQELKVGSGVQLAHGGQFMTITEMDGKIAMCEWHDDKGHPQKSRYPLAALVLI